MKVLVMDMKDDEGTGVNIAMRAQDYGHEVNYWTDGFHPAGKGLLPRPREWEAHAASADLIILTGNCDYPDGLEAAFEEGLPIFGTNPRAAELELDRGKGQALLAECGIETLPFVVVSSVEEGIAKIAETDEAYVMKPWGGDSDKAMTCVAKSPEDGIFTLQRWQKEGKFKGQLMLQQKVDGIEIGVSAFFGPHGWSTPIEESFEHKKLMNEELGPNTGEMGTVIRHVENSKLFDMLLAPLTSHLVALNYVGDVSVNCIVDDKGTPWPLEFTMRLGWPDFNIRQELIEGDPVEWMYLLVHGEDALRISSKIAVGIVMAHGDFPREDDEPKVWAGYPLRGITDDNLPHLQFQQVMLGKTPALEDGEVVQEEAILTAGTYPLVVTGSGSSVSAARAAAYTTAWEIKWPSNVMFRTDIGNRLEEELPKLQEHGFAEGMEF